MNCRTLILQHWGLGDCIFAQGVAHHFLENGHEVIWPVKSKFLEGLSFAYPLIKWCSCEEMDPRTFEQDNDLIKGDLRIIPLRFSDSILKIDKSLHMKAKYMAYGLDYRTWRNFARYKRNLRKELELAELMNIDLGSEYSLINENFSLGVRKIRCKNKSKFNMKELQGYSLFDFSTIIEHAKEIHMVDSAMFYLVELLDLSAREIHLYSRYPFNDSFSHTDYLFTKKYKLHFGRPKLI